MTPMNAGALSFLTSLETPSRLSFSAEFSAEDEAGNGAFDGFANLLDQLVQIAPIQSDSVIPGTAPTIPQDALDLTDLESGNGGGKESGKDTGKILPVLPVMMPGLASIQPFTLSETASPAVAAKVVDLPVGRLDTARMTQAAAMTPLATGDLPVASAEISRLATLAPEAKGSAPAPAPAPVSGGIVAALANATTSGPAIAATVPAASTVMTPAPTIFGTVPPATANGMTPAPQPLVGTPIAAITIAAAPTTSAALSSRVETAVAKDLPVAASDTARRILGTAEDAPAPVAPAVRTGQAPAPAIMAQAAATVLPGLVAKSDVTPGPVSTQTDTTVLPTTTVKSDAKPAPAPTQAAAAVLPTVAAKDDAKSGPAPTQAAAVVLPATVTKSDAKPGPAAQAAAIAPAAASTTDGEADTARPVEAVQAPARMAPAVETPRIEPAIAAPSVPTIASNASETVTRAADLARPDAFAAIDSIARMVDRLSAARDFGVVPTAALAVMHKEFGELSIAIDRVSDTLQVEVAAKDGEAQRALAAALANERSAALAGDRGPQRSFEPQQTTAQTHHHTAGQSSAGADRGGADTFGQAASGNAQSQREGQNRERTRPDGQALHTRNSAASDRQSASDDGRYA